MFFTADIFTQYGRKLTGVILLNKKDCIPCQCRRHVRNTSMINVTRITKLCCEKDLLVEPELENI